MLILPRIERRLCLLPLGVLRHANLGLVHIAQLVLPDIQTRILLLQLHEFRLAPLRLHLPLDVPVRLLHQPQPTRRSALETFEEEVVVEIHP